MEAANNKDNQEENKKRKHVDEVPTTVPSTVPLSKNQRKKLAKRLRKEEMEKRMKATATATSATRQVGAAPVEDVTKRAAINVPVVVDNEAIRQKLEQQQKEYEQRVKATTATATRQIGVASIQEVKKPQAANVRVVDNKPVDLKFAKGERKGERRRQKLLEEQRKEEEERLAKVKEFQDQVLGLKNNTLTELNRSYTEDQAKSIGLALAGNSSLKQLILHVKPSSFYGDSGLTLPVTQALCDGIKQSQLKELWICGNIKDTETCQCLYQTVQALSSLKILLASLHDDDSLDEDNIIALGQALENNTSIRELSFHVGFDLTNAGAEALASGLQHAQIQKLEVRCGNCTSGSAVRKLFEAVRKKMQSLEVLTISEFRSQIPLKCFVAGLQSTTSLKELVFKNGDLNVGAIRVLSRSLRQNHSVTTLRLVGNFINDAGIIEFASHLNRDSCLQELHLGAEEDGQLNVFGPRGVRALVAAVANMPAMRTLNLSCSECLGYRAYKIIGDALPRLTLCELDLRFYCEPDEEEGGDDEEAEDDDDNDDEETNWGQKAELALLLGMRENEHVCKLSVFWRAFDGRFEKLVGFYAARNLYGRRLLTTNHGLSSTIWCYVMEKAQKKNPHFGPSLVYFILREQRNLVHVSSR